MSQPLSPILLEARGAWERQYQVEWEDLEELLEDPAQTISSFTVSISPAGPTAANLTVSGTKTLFDLDLSDFTAGTVYTLTVEVTTSGGRVIDREGKIVVRS